MIYITGDCHSNFERFSTSIFPEQYEMTKEDYVIICGDFGGVWNKDEESKKEKWWMDWLEEKPFTTLFVDGNHENFDRLYAYSVEEWNGGKVHKIRPSVIHLMRGQVFTINGKKIFTFGGASSHDVSGGIFEQDDPNLNKKIRKANESWKPYRINHVSWWREELPSVDEMEEGRANLEKYNYEVDFIVTHCCSAFSEILLNGFFFNHDYLNDYFDEIREKTKFTKWFFGHYHDNKNVSDREILLYEQIIRIA